jgi:hypothetical protein
MSSPGAFSAQLDQDPDNGGEPPVDADLLLHFVDICLQNLSGDERDKFVGSLHNILSQGVDQMFTPPKKTNGNGNGQARPGGSNTTLDCGVRSGNRGSTDRRPAQDRAIAGHVAAVNRDYGFFARFPDARRIKFSSNGRD